MAFKHGAWTAEEKALLRDAYRQVGGSHQRAWEILQGKIGHPRNYTGEMARALGLVAPPVVMQEPPRPVPTPEGPVYCLPCRSVMFLEPGHDLTCLVCGSTIPVEAPRMVRRGMRRR